MQAWGFTTQQYRVPDPAELSTLLAHVDYTQVQLDGTLRPFRMMCRSTSAVSQRATHPTG